MIQSKTDKLNLLTFENISDFTRYLDRNKDSVNQRSLDVKGDWTGVYSWEEFQKYLREGNPDITEKVREYSKFYIDKFEEQFATHTEYMFDVVGEFFDIGTVMMGEPEAWIKEIKVEDDKFITLNIQGTYPYNTDLEMVEKNASKVFAIAVVLEQQGFLVRINMIYRSIKSDIKNKSRVTEAMIRVKDYDSVLDYKKFGILLGIPFFRRGYLRLLEIEYGKNCASSYGNPKLEEGDINLDKTENIDDLERRLKNESI